MIIYSVTVPFCLTDHYDVIRKLMTTYLDTGSTQTPLRGRGRRETKSNDRYHDTDEDDELPVVNVSSQ